MLMRIFTGFPADKHVLYHHQKHDMNFLACCLLIFLRDEIRMHLIHLHSLHINKLYMEKTTERIAPGKYVELGYDLYSLDGGKETLVHQTDPEDPERIVFGVTPGVVAPLEKALEGLEKDSTFEVKATAAEAFGPYDKEQIVTLDRDIFLVDGKFDSETITPGAIVPMMTADGYRINGIVEEVTADKVRMDFNHPLAGKDVLFKGRVLLVRDATPEELHPSHNCGCKGGCGSSGSDCNCDDSCSCGDGCGCN